MADAGTIRGGFELSADQPIRQLRSIRDMGREADERLQTLGRTMDNLPIRAAAGWGGMTRVVDREVATMSRRIDELSLKLDDLGSKSATPTIDMSGVERANAQISELERRLDRLDRRRVSPHVSAGGGGIGSLPVNNQAGGGGMPFFSTLGGIGGKVPWWAAAVPFAPQLLGGAGALTGSLASGALGAGVVGLGGMGALGFGGAASLGMGKNAIKDLGEVVKAQTAYNKALQEYGPRSAQAARAQRGLNVAMAEAPVGAAGAARQVALLRSEYQTATAPGYSSFYGSVGQGAYSVRRALPQLAPLGNQALGVTGRAAADFTGFLTSPQSISSYRTMTAGFVTELPIMERSLQSIVRLFFNLSKDAIPFFHEGDVWVNNWTRNMANQSENTGRVQGKMQGLVTSAKDWVSLLGTAGRTLKDLFAPGVTQGDSMVVEFAHTLDRWDSWLQRNPEKVRKFFADGVSGTAKIASTIGNLAKDVSQIFQYLQPILSRAEDFIKFASGLGGGNLALGGAALYGGYQGVRNVFGGRGPSAGALAGSVILGSTTPSVRSMTRAPGGGVVLAPFAAQGAQLLGRQNAGYLVPRTNFQIDSPYSTGVLAVGQRGGGLRTPVPVETVSARGPVAFQQAYGDVPGARYAGPISELGQEVTTINKATTALKGFGAGVARFAAPLLVLQGILGGVAGGKDGGGFLGTVAGAAHGLTLGLTPAYRSDSQEAQASAQQALNAAPVQANARFDFLARYLQRGVPRGMRVPFGAPQFNDPRIRQETTILGGEQLNTLTQRAGEVTSLRGAQRLARQTVQLDLQLPDDVRRKFHAQLQDIINTGFKNAGGAAASGWAAAFEQGIGKGNKPQKMVDTMLGGMMTQIKRLGPVGAKQFAQSTADWVKQMEASDPKLRAPLERAMRGIVADINQTNRATGMSWQDMQRKIFYFNGQIFTGTDQAWGAIRDSLVDKATVAQEKVAGIWGQVQQDAINALTGMGFSQGEAKTIVTSEVKGGAAAKTAGSAVRAQTSGTSTGQAAAGALTLSLTAGGNARGGMIRGKGLLDTVPVGDGSVAAPGEAWIANRHAMKDLDTAALAYYGKTAWQMIRDEDRPHSFGMRNQTRTSPLAMRLGHQQRTFALGGLFGDVAANVATPAKYVFPFAGQGWSWSRTDQGVDFGGSAPVGAIGPYRVTYSNPSDGWYSPAPAFMVYQLTGGADAGKYVYVAEHLANMAPIGQSGPSGQAIAQMTGGIEMGWAAGPQGHQIQMPMGADHLTAAGQDFHNFLMGLTHGQITGGRFGGGGMGAPAPQIHLKQRSSGAKGWPGMVGDTNLLIKTRALEKAINKKIARMSPGGGGATAGGVAGPTVTASWFDDPQTASGRVHVPGFAELSHQGSMDFSALGHLPMGRIIDVGANGVTISIPKVDVGAGGAPLPGASIRGIDLTREAAQQIPGFLQAGLMNVNWRDTGRQAFSRGGSVNWAGWKATGADFLTHGPTVVGAGEGGRRERVRITPAHTPTPVRSQVVVQITGPVYARDAKEVEQLANDIGEKLIEALDRSGGATDRELLAGAA